jgi:OOP family OmpA-OmpF porin
MKLGLLLLATTLLLLLSQDSSTTVNSSTEYPNTFSSGSANVQPFDNKARRFRDWSISVGGGAAFMVHSDLKSIRKDKSTGDTMLM